MKRAVICCLAIGLTIACNKKSTFEDGVKAHEHVGNEPIPEFRAAAIQAAKRHVQKYQSDCRIQGVAPYPWAGTTWLTSVDCLIGESRTNVHLRVELFIQDDGFLYWKTEYVPPDAGARPLEFVIEPYEPDHLGKGR